MNIEILGCSGGIGGQQANSGTTCLRLGKHLLIDAGSGLGRLPLAEQQQITDILLSHTHMDHICDLPAFLANQFERTDLPVTVHALPETIEVLKDCIFNHQIWPDFTQLPSASQPVLRFVAVQPWQSFTLDSIKITPFFVEHSVPTVGFSLSDEWQHFVYTADTTYSQTLVDELNRLGHIDTLMVECAFPDSKRDIALMTRHMTPSLIQQTLDGLAEQPRKLWITHLKPTCEQEIRREIRSNSDYHHWRLLP